MRLLILAALAIALAPNIGRAQDVSASREAAFDAERDLEPGDLGVVDNLDGTWSYSLPEGFDPLVSLRGRILTWAYIGQARHSWEPQPPSRTRYWVAGVDQPETPREQLLQIVRIDHLGRQWRVVDVDEAALSAVLQDSRERFPEESDHSLHTSDESWQPRPQDAPHAPDSVVPWEPSAWSHLNCDPEPGNDTHIWDSDSRIVVSDDPATHSPLKATTVIVRIEEPGLPGRICSGVSVTQNAVLTAAHCVSDDDNESIPTSWVRVWRDDLDPDASIAALEIDLNQSYTGGSGEGGGTDFENDWAIIKLRSTWVASGYSATPVMALSTASNATIGALSRVHNLGFPGWAPYCASAGGALLFYNEEAEDVAGILTKSLRLNIDGTDGHSGGPVFFCPTGDDNFCLTGETGHVIMVWAGWNPVITKYVGPKVPYFQVAMTAIIND